jgi:ribosomal protein S6
MKDNKNKYQMVLVFGQKVEDKDREKVLIKIGSWLKDKKAVVEKTDHTGMKELVYEIKGQRKGDFWMLDVVGEVPIKLTELNLYLNRETSIIRYLILKV